jgi:Lamin Tail Domain
VERSISCRIVDVRRQWLRLAALATVSIAVAAGSAACFSPRFERCAVGCPEGVCPDGMICRSDGVCYESEEEDLCEVAAEVDGGPSDAGMDDVDGGDRPDAGEPDAAPDAGPPVVPTEAGQIIVTEIHKDPAAVPDDSGEWFEIHNPTDLTLDLSALEFSDLSAPDADFFFLPDDITLPPGGYLVLGVRDGVTNGGVPVDIVWDVGEIQFFLGNEGADEIIVSTAGGALELDRVVYDETFPNIPGRSMSLDPDQHNEVDNDDQVNWCEGQDAYGDGDLGTPGEANPVVPESSCRSKSARPSTGGTPVSGANRD